MSIMKTNIFNIMSEASRTSVINTNNQNIDRIAESVADQISSLDEMNIEFTFTPEMAPVIFDESTGKYFVEYDMLAKLYECGDCISLDTKYGKICFEPKTDDCKMDEPGDEPITEEEPNDSEDEDDVENTIDESYFHPFYTYHDNVYCWEKDALNQVILANINHDPNREELDRKNGCDIPEMTMENTYIVIESEDNLLARIHDVSESAKSGGVALKNGKAQLIKAEDAFKNMINHGLKVIKKKSKKEENK